MKIGLIEKLKSKVYLKRDKERIFISSDLIKEIRIIQMKMNYEYKKKHKKRYMFDRIRASDYIARIIKEHRK